MAAPPSSPSQPRIQIDRHSIQITCCKEPLSDDVALELVQIPGGEFLMGSPDDEVDRSSAESPQHLVQVPGFWMGQYPITQAEWRIVASFPKVDHELDPGPSNFKGTRHPVECVTWYDAMEFCARLTQHTRRAYRLPSEAEWEYACRGGSTTPFHFGETITTDLANYRGTDNEKFNWSGSYGQGPKGEYRETTTPVDHFGIANAFGLCDMHGNVWEWCLDHWHENYGEAPIDGSAWLSEDEKSDRVFRGGSWSTFPRHCRSAYRNRDHPDGRTYDIGFRVVVAPGGLR